MGCKCCQMAKGPCWNHTHTHSSQLEPTGEFSKPPHTHAHTLPLAPWLLLLLRLAFFCTPGVTFFNPVFFMWGMGTVS